MGPERLEIEALQRGEDPGLIYGASAVNGEEVEEDEEADAAEPEEEIDEDSEDSEEEEVEEEKPKPGQKRKAKGAKVSKGKKDAPSGKHAEQDAAEEKRLAKSAMPKKMKRLHDKIQYAERKEKRVVTKLQEKRKVHDEKKQSGGKQMKQPASKKAKR